MNSTGHVFYIDVTILRSEFFGTSLNLINMIGFLCHLTAMDPESAPYFGTFVMLRYMYDGGCILFKINFVEFLIEQLMKYFYFWLYDSDYFYRRVYA